MNKCSGFIWGGEPGYIPLSPMFHSLIHSYNTWQVCLWACTSGFTPNNFIYAVCLGYRMTPIIDTEVLENMRMSQFVGHAPKPAHIRYNQVPYDLDRDMREHVPESPMKRGQWKKRHGSKTRTASSRFILP